LSVVYPKERFHSKVVNAFVALAKERLAQTRAKERLAQTRAKERLAQTRANERRRHAA
jgi:hypothetical protein